VSSKKSVICLFIVSYSVASMESNAVEISITLSELLI
jgi:hypothetical protein